MHIGGDDHPVAVGGGGRGFCEGGDYAVGEIRCCLQVVIAMVVFVLMMVVMVVVAMVVLLH